MTCTHDGFHSGQGRYDRDAGSVRYVLVCDDCQAEIAQLRVEPYNPAFHAHGNDGRDQGANGGRRPNASNKAS